MADGGQGTRDRARDSGAVEPRLRSFDDERMEIAMGRILQSGVLLASLVVLIGGLLYVLADHGKRPEYGSFNPAGNKVWLLHPGPLVQGIAQGAPSAIIQLGMLLLIATPIARVVCAVVAFALEKDRLYVAVSAGVLAVLLWGMLRGG